MSIEDELSRAGGPLLTSAPGAFAAAADVPVDALAPAVVSADPRPPSTSPMVSGHHADPVRRRHRALTGFLWSVDRAIPSAPASASMDRVGEGRGHRRQQCLRPHHAASSNQAGTTSNGLIFIGSKVTTVVVKLPAW
jgi:hypothetical protein